MDLFELTAAEAVARMREGHLSPVEYLQALMNRIDDTEPRVQAWEAVDAEGALATARDLQERRVEMADRAVLFGLPVGIKDLFDVEGMPTTANFAPYAGRTPAEDSGVVRHLREAGAVILGKTVTVQFAWGTNSPKTRNPWHPQRSPGGSSSGSGAAVAARQVPLATGTQTGGSVLRPAAYCGVVGLKPTFGRLSRYGLLPVSWTLDHAGVLARTVEDAGLALQALARHDPRDPYSARQEPEDFVSPARNPGRPPRLGLVRDLLDLAEPDVREAALAAVGRLSGAGAEIEEVSLPAPMDLLLAVHHLHMAAEGAAVHSQQHATLAAHYWPRLRANIEVGQLVPAAVYVHAGRLRRRLRRLMERLVGSVDGLIGPAVSNLPPDLSTTGDMRFQSIFTLFGFPNIAMPTGLSPDGLPHSIQIVGRHFEERSLLGVAAWCEAVLGALPAPPL